MPLLIRPAGPGLAAILASPDDHTLIGPGAAEAILVGVYTRPQPGVITER